MGRPMQANLQGNLHHQTTEHERGIIGGAAYRKRPRAKQTERLNHQITLRDIGNGCPQKMGDWARERG